MTMATSTSSLVRLEIRGDHIAVLQMLSGENKWNLTMVNDIQKALDQVESNTSIKGLVLTGQGKFFLFGLDLLWMSQQTADVLVHFLKKSGELVHRLLVFPIPTVAAINGHAFGQGAILSLVCDYRVMNNGRGWWCLPESKLKLKLQAPTLTMIKSKISRADTLRDAAVYSKRFPAEEALSGGIIDEAVPQNEVIPAGIRYCKEIVGDGIDRDVIRSIKERLYGNDMLAMAEKESQKMSPADQGAKIQAFKKGATLIPSKM